MTDRRSKTRLGFFNWADESDFPIEQALEPACKKLTEAVVLKRITGEDADWAHQYQLVVLHNLTVKGVPYGRSKLCDQEFKSNDKLICVLVSRDALSGTPMRISNSGGVRYVLSVQNPNVEPVGDKMVAESCEFWETLIRTLITEGCLDAWFREESDDFVEEHSFLTDVFGYVNPRRVEWDLALNILCQGYLSVCAANGDKEAERAIGKYVDGIDASLLEEVQSPAWWQAVLGEQRPEDSWLPACLMSDIYTVGTPLQNSVTPEAVLLAYRELRSRLY